MHKRCSTRWLSQIRAAIAIIILFPLFAAALLPSQASATGKKPTILRGNLEASLVTLPTGAPRVFLHWLKPSGRIRYLRISRNKLLPNGKAAPGLVKRFTLSRSARNFTDNPGFGVYLYKLTATTAAGRSDSSQPLTVMVKRNEPLTPTPSPSATPSSTPTPEPPPSQIPTPSPTISVQPTTTPTRTPTPTSTPSQTPTSTGTIRPLSSSDHVTQYGVTFYFDTNYQVGQFANGDFFVLPHTPGDPVRITRITPDYLFDRASTPSEACNTELGSQCTASPDPQHVGFCRPSAPTTTSGFCYYEMARNGWQANLVQYQGFDSRARRFNPSLVPTLPFNAFGTTSLIKSISKPEGNTHCSYNAQETCVLNTAVVLTVLDTAPQNNGATAFRPPFAGTTYKPLFLTSQLQLQNLPRLSPRPSLATPLAQIAAEFQRPTLDLYGDDMRSVHPDQNLPNYGADIAIRNADGFLNLMLDDPVEEKLPALINYIQGGIDTFGLLGTGMQYKGSGGQGEGRLLPVLAAALLLNDGGMKGFIADPQLPRDTFGELGVVVLALPDPASPSTPAQPIFAQTSDTEERYWDVFLDYNAPGSRTLADPYRHIDGGHLPGTSYQAIVSGPGRGTALAIRLFPGMQALLNRNEYLRYIDRWVETGALALPDPCAPATGVCAGGPNPGTACTSASPDSICGSGGSCDFAPRKATDYGVLYGPHPLFPGKCIGEVDSNGNPANAGGRRPLYQGYNRNNSLSGYGTPFESQMWSLFRGAAGAVCGNGIREPGEQCDDGNLLAGDGCSAECRLEGVVSEPGLEAYFDFEQQSLDRTGNGNDGSPLSAATPSPTYTSGRHGMSLSFPGVTGSCLALPGSTSLNFFSTFTIAAWVYREASNRVQTIVGRGNISSNPQYEQYGLSLYDFTSPGGPERSLARMVISNGTQEVAAFTPFGSTTYDIPLAQWTHIAATFDGASIKMYVNGALASSTVVPPNFGLLNSQPTVSVGCSVGGDITLAGRLDGLYMYNRALTGSEVAALYQR